MTRPAFRWPTLWAATGALSIPLALAFVAAKPVAPKAKAAPVDRNTCYGCHEEVKALKEGSKHAKLACETCHDDLAKHVTDVRTPHYNGWDRRWHCRILTNCSG